MTQRLPSQLVMTPLPLPKLKTLPMTLPLEGAVRIELEEGIATRLKPIHVNLPKLKQ